MLPLLGSPYNIGQGFTVNADGSVELTKQVPATANYGLLSVGSGPWDGTSPGHFTGSAQGTVIAVNTSATFAGSMMQLQKAGIVNFIIDSTGALGARTIGSTSFTHSYLDLSTTSVIAIARNTNDVPLIARATANATSDIFQVQNSVATALIGVRPDGLLYASLGALATKEKAGAPTDADWTTAPPDCTIIGDSTNNKIWIRLGGVWKGVAVA